MLMVPFSNQKCHFSRPFSDLAFRQKIMSSLLRLERKQKYSSNPFRIRIFLFLSHSFGIETIRTFIYTHIVPAKTTPDSRPNWAKSISVFRPKRRKNPTRWGGRYLYGLYKGYPQGHRVCSKENHIMNPAAYK